MARQAVDKSERQIAERADVEVDHGKLFLTIELGGVAHQAEAGAVDDEGRFKLRGLGKTINPDTVEVACAKQGYRTLEVMRRRMSRREDAAVEIECLLEPEK